jgi:hypothetical protein
MQRGSSDDKKGNKPVNRENGRARKARVEDEGRRSRWSDRGLSASPVRRQHRGNPLEDEDSAGKVRAGPRQSSSKGQQNAIAASAGCNGVSPVTLRLREDLLAAYRDYCSPSTPPLMGTVSRSMESMCCFRYGLLTSTDYKACPVTVALRANEKWLFRIVSFPKEEEL